jgi:TRAP-type uncharacterized transport system substrate-binding protein
VAYDIVKNLWDYNQELGAIHVRLKDWSTDRFVNSTNVIPYHPGAIKFYKEKGIWTQEMEQRQDQLVAEKK